MSDIVERLKDECARAAPDDIRVRAIDVINRLREEIKQLEDKLEGLSKIVALQGQDEGLWFMPKHPTEHYLQQSLLRLHKEIDK